MYRFPRGFGSRKVTQCCIAGTAKHFLAEIDRESICLEMIDSTEISNFVNND